MHRRTLFEREKNLPLSQRFSVACHHKYNSVLTRETSENHLSQSEPGDYIVRLCSKGEDLVVTYVSDFYDEAVEFNTNEKGYFIKHWLLDANSPLYPPIFASKDPIGLIELQIKNLVPLTKRDSVTSHAKFLEISKDEAVNHLINGKIGEFIVRQSSTNNNYLAVTYLSNIQVPGVEHDLSNDGHFIKHWLIEPNDPFYFDIISTPDPIEKIADIINTIHGLKNNKVMGHNKQ